LSESTIHAKCYIAHLFQHLLPEEMFSSLYEVSQHYSDVMMNHARSIVKILGINSSNTLLAVLGIFKSVRTQFFHE